MHSAPLSPPPPRKRFCKFCKAHDDMDGELVWKDIPMVVYEAMELMLNHFCTCREK